MTLTSQQLAVLLAAINADPVLAVLPPNSDSASTIADAFNRPSTPPVIVWRREVTWDEIMGNGMDWARVDNLSIGKARIWEWMFKNAGQSFNPAKPNIRAGIDACWTGTQADTAVRAAVYVHCKRVATRAEALFAVGTGTDAAPSTMSADGDLQYQTVEAARNV